MVFQEAEPEVVAFSCLFFQTIPSLSLARRVKLRSAKVRTVFGGAGVHSEMGKELIEKTPWMDAVSIGEADDVVVPLMRACQNGIEPEGLPGVQYRTGAGDIQSGSPYRPTSVQVMESLPAPDFDDFIADVDRFGRSEKKYERAPVFLPFES